MIICITGIDGCGKTTQIELLSDYLKLNGQNIFLSKAYGKKEKQIFSEFINGCDQVAILFLFQALHVQQRIKTERALGEGKIVITDRWDESYLVYHAKYGTLATDSELRETINKMAFHGIKPDITFLIDLPTEEASKRCALRQKGKDRFDLLPSEYHETMRRGYLDLAKIMNWTIIDGAEPAPIIHKQIISYLSIKTQG